MRISDWSSDVCSSGLLGSALGACSMMPAYERPVAPTPSVWPKGEAYGTGENAAAASGADAHSLGWEAFFRAPELQALIRTALDNNRDLRAAALRVEAYREIGRAHV